MCKFLECINEYDVYKSIYCNWRARWTNEWTNDWMHLHVDSQNAIQSISNEMSKRWTNERKYNNCCIHMTTRPLALAHCRCMHLLWPKLNQENRLKATTKKRTAERRKRREQNNTKKKKTMAKLSKYTSWSILRQNSLFNSKFEIQGNGILAEVHSTSTSSSAPFFALIFLESMR